MSTNIDQYRKPEYPIQRLLLERWSPRAMSGEGLSQDELDTLFEAARWAPSCFNEQPWRFLYAHRDSPEWPLFFDLLVQANQAWAENAGVLITVVSKMTFSHNSRPNASHSLDAGAAWENLALQASSMGLVAHGMAGFDHDKARADLNIPEDYSVEVMIAVGRPGDPTRLPVQLLERERPSSRLEVAKISIQGRFCV
jgi:nitroreductase